MRNIAVMLIVLQKVKRFLLRCINKVVQKESLKVRIRNWLEFDKIRQGILQNFLRYDSIARKLCAQHRSGKKIRVAFFVVYDSAFLAIAPLYQIMAQDAVFDPFILVIPDTFRGNENMIYQLDKSYNSLREKHFIVKKGYDEAAGCFKDFNTEFDLFCTINPYDAMTHEFFTLCYLSSKGKLGFYISYGYIITNWSERLFANEFFFNNIWKIFLTPEEISNETIKKMPNCGINIVHSGYCKMDAFADVKIINNTTRKRIIIAPHHTVTKVAGYVNLSQFFKFSTFFLNLPILYRDINFIFRPHPLLFPGLLKNSLWSKERIEEYINNIKSHCNAVYDTSGDYFDLFANSDGLIHDGGSFIAEYMYTGRPQCYMLSSVDEFEIEFNPFARRIISEYTYHAFSENDIKNFIENVIINGNDIKKKRRDIFTNKKLKQEYPYAGEKIIHKIKNELGLYDV